MSLIILLILSEDESFNKMVHETVSYSYYENTKFISFLIFLEIKKYNMVHRKSINRNITRGAFDFGRYKNSTIQHVKNEGQVPPHELSGCTG